MTDKPILEYYVSAERNDAHGCIASCNCAEIKLDTDPAARAGALPGRA
jgi:hypothetical protein